MGSNTHGRKAMLAQAALLTLGGMPLAMRESFEHENESDTSIKQETSSLPKSKAFSESDKLSLKRAQEKRDRRREKRRHLASTQIE